MADVTTKAAILEEQGKPLVVDELVLPSLGRGQVQVRVHSTSICGTQIGEIRGDRGPDNFLPHLLGHEGGGIVEDIGEDVTFVKPGDHVVMHWRPGIGLESDFPKYKRGKGIVGAGLVTTFNERAVVSENRLTAVAKDIPFDILALMGCSVTTGMGIVKNEALLQKGQSIAVFGCGGVGLNVIQGAKLAGAKTIIGVDINHSKRELARECGGDLLLSSLFDSEFETGNKLGIAPGGVDVVVECTGIPKLIALAYELTKPGGRTVLAGLPRFDQSVTFPNMLGNLSKTLLWSAGGLTNPTEDIPFYLNLYKEGKLKLDHLITHRFKLEDINEALDTSQSGVCGKVVLEMG